MIKASTIKPFNEELDAWTKWLRLVHPDQVGNSVLWQRIIPLAERGYVPKLSRWQMVYYGIRNAIR